jgi:hypothetical protein
MDHPRAGLRYVDADDLDDSAFEFDGLDVESHTGDKLGDVDGFIIDIDSARPYYVVVNAGGWFTSKYFLLPIGHVALDTAGNRLVADVSRDRVGRYPGFDRGEFEKLTETDLNRMDEQMMGVCCPDEPVDATATRRYQTSRHYQSPTWWDASFYRPDRADTTAKTIAATAPMAATMTSQDDAAARDRHRDVVPPAPVRTESAEQVVARSRDDSSVGDVSPHLGGRAQPGDVLGVETGGEQTHIGETSEDENERRRDAEKDAAKAREK